MGPDFDLRGAMGDAIGKMCAAFWLEGKGEKLGGAKRPKGPAFMIRGIAKYSSSHPSLRACGGEGGDRKKRKWGTKSGRSLQAGRRTPASGIHGARGARLFEAGHTGGAVNDDMIIKMS